MEIALKCGKSCSVTKRKSIKSFNEKYVSNEYWVILIHKRKERIVMRKPKYIDYHGRVYCVGVKNHIILVRRNGKVIWSGNTTELIIDEQSAGEEAGGQRHINAALYDVSTSPDIRIIQSSTAHYIFGDFLKTFNDADKLGYKKYTWAIAKHISGNTNSYETYKDKDPLHWKSNLPWIPDINIHILRKKSSDDEWLVESLGGISLSSGLVMNPLDLSSCVCDGRGVCPAMADDHACQAYISGKCILPQYVVNVLEGVEGVPINTKEAITKFIHERVMGIDWGRGSPCAYVVLGKYKDWVFVLDTVEVTGLNDQEKIQMADELAQKWQIEIIRPDPREWVLNGMLMDKGYTIHELFSFEGGNEKYKYISTLKKYVERHHIMIPRQFEDLIRSLRMLAFDENGKIRKVDDHSADACSYAVSLYGEMDTESALWEIDAQKRGMQSMWK